MVFLSTKIFGNNGLLGLLLLHYYFTAVVCSAYTNLTQEWELSDLYNKNEGYCAIQTALALRLPRINQVVGYVVVKDGIIVAEGYNPSHNAIEKNPVFSITKSFTSMLIGYLVQEEVLSLDRTLGSIFENATDWEGVDDADEKQAITLHEILTMTGGLFDDETVDGQETLTEVLNKMMYDPDLRGRFNYLGYVHILSRIILRVTGRTPRELAIESGLFPALGIQDSNYTWDTFGGIEGSAIGFRTNPRTMAKLGVLYLQQGHAAENVSLIESDWVEASGTNQLRRGDATQFFNGYGYQWWTQLNEQGLLPLLPILDGAYQASGIGGHLINVFPEINTVVAIISDDADPNLFLINILDNINNMDKEVQECRFSIPSFVGSLFGIASLGIGYLINTGVEVIRDRLGL